MWTILFAAGGALVAVIVVVLALAYTVSFVVLQEQHRCDDFKYGRPSF